MTRWLRLPASVSHNYKQAIIWALLSGAIIYGAFIGYLVPNYKSGKIVYNAENWVMAENAYLRYPDERDTREKVELKKGEQVKPLAVQLNALGRRQSVQVENAQGDRGFIPIQALNTEIEQDLLNLPVISPSYKYLTTYETLEKKVLGKKIAEIERRYGPATAIIPLEENTREAYFETLNLTKDKAKYYGVFLITDENQRVIDIELHHKTRRYTLDERFPLAQLFRKVELFRLTGSYYIREPLPIISQLSNSYKQFINKHWSTKILGFFVTLVRFFLVFSIPFFLIYPIKTLIYYNTRISNAQALWAFFILSALSFYLFLVYLGLMDGQILIFAFFLGLVFSFWLRREWTNIEYNRCDYCNHMNLVVGKGSNFLGRSKSEEWGTYLIDKGTTETESTKTRHYERRSKQTITTEDKYHDHRYCTDCEFEWNVKRSVINSITRHF